MSPAALVSTCPSGSAHPPGDMLRMGGWADPLASWLASEGVGLEPFLAQKVAGAIQALSEAEQERIGIKCVPLGERVSASSSPEADDRERPANTDGSPIRLLKMADLRPFECVSQPMWVFDLRALRVAWCNNAAIPFWNAESREELLKRSFADASTSTKTRLLRQLRKVLNDKETEPEQWTLYPKKIPTPCVAVFPAAVFTGSEEAGPYVAGNFRRDARPSSGSKVASRGGRQLKNLRRTRSADGKFSEKAVERPRADSGKSDSSDCSLWAPAGTQPAGLLIQITKVGDSASSQAATEEQMRGVEALRHASVSVIFLRQSDLQCLMHNPAAERAFGDLESTPFSSLLVHSAERAHFELSISERVRFSEVVCIKAFADPHSIQVSRGEAWRDTVTKSAEREERWFAVDAHSVLDPMSGEQCISVSASDVTDSVLARKMTEQFLLNMSHEVRTPIAGVIGCLNMIGDEKQRLSKGQSDALDMANFSAELMHQVLNDILDYTKATSGRMRLEKLPFDLRKWADSTMTVPRLNEAVQGGSVELELSFTPLFPSLGLRNGHTAIFREPPQFLVGDSFRLGQMVLNLTGNALKFTAKGHVKVSVLSFAIEESLAGNAEASEDPPSRDSPVSPLLRIDVEGVLSELSAEASRAAVCAKMEYNALNDDIALSAGDEGGIGSTENLLIVVEDTGIGIKKDSLETIWNAFEQADSSTTRRYGGTGLGLAITRELAEAMRGQVVVYSEEDVGSVFAMALELAPASEDDMLAAGRNLSPPLTPRKEEQKPDTSDLDARGPLKVLLVDDNPLNVKVNTHMIVKCGHQVDVCTDGFEALRKFDRMATLPHSLDSADEDDMLRFPVAGYDVVLMDVSMPIMNGVDAAVAIRNVERFLSRPPVYIGALTAHGLPQHETMCLEAGMNERLVKPVSRLALTKVFDRVYDEMGTAALSTT